MRLQRFSLGAAGVLAASLFSLTAHAYKAGITGFSGKAGSTVTCMSSSCHGGHPSAEAPTVTLSGPENLAAGATGTYTLTISGGPAVTGGLDVAVNGGTLAKATDDLQLIGGELTHKSPKPFPASGPLTFDFSLVAPSTDRTITIYASGNSTNNSNTNDGDHSAPATLDVHVTGGSTPDAGTPDAGTDNNPPPTDNNNDKGGCAAAGGAPVALLLAVVAERLRRRRAA